MTKLRQAARDEPCIRCNVQDGTVVLAHYSGDYNHWYGNGMGTKSNDLAGAHLCHNCHEFFDKRKSSGLERELEFHHLILKTIIKLEKQGKIKV